MTTKATAQCFAHRHLTFAEYGLYSHLREVSSKHNFQYHFDDRTLAARFAHQRGSSKDTCNRLRNGLVRKGFLEWLEAPKRVHGRFTARLGRILSHQEYAAKYPDACRACSDSETGTSIKNATGTSLKFDAHQSHQRDVIGIEKQQEERRSGIAAALPFSLPSSGNTVEEPLAESEAPVSPAIQVKSESVSNAVPDNLRGLVRLVEQHVIVKQTTDDLPNLGKITKLTAAQLETAFAWATNDPFWNSKFSGSTALRTFLKHLPTIATQRRRDLKASVAKHKAASVAPDAAKPFQYVGETL